MQSKLTAFVDCVGVIQTRFSCGACNGAKLSTLIAGNPLTARHNTSRSFNSAQRHLANYIRTIALSRSVIKREW